jgi:hypothetical protein
VLCEQILPQKTRWTEPELAVFRKRQESMAHYFKGEQRKEGQTQIIGSTSQDKTQYAESMHRFDLPTNSFGASFLLREGERFYLNPA